MRRIAPLLTAAALVAGCGGESSTVTVVRTVTETTAEPAPPVRRVVFYGHIESMRRAGDVHEVRVDPALWLNGETANRAAAEDGVVEAGEPVPNDYYVRDEDDELLTYLVPDDARVTIVAQGPTDVDATVEQLATLVAGGEPEGIEPFSRELGYWFTVEIDRAVAIEQQYQP